MTSLDDVLQPHVDSGATPGAVALVASADDIEVSTVGTTVLGGDEPMRRDTIFRIASISKPIAAAVAMTLVEDGTFALDDPVNAWLPELDGARVVRTPAGPIDDTVPLDRLITVRDLLTFQSGYGFPDDFSYPAVAPLFSELGQGSAMGQDAPAPDEWMARLARIPLLHQPGGGWLYNTASDVLGVLLARATGRPLPDVFAQRVLGPLGMVDTSFVVPAEKVDRMPAFYRPADEGLTLADPADGAWTRPAPFPSAAGGLVSTVDDWYAFARMLLEGGRVGAGRMLSEESVRLMMTDHTTERMRADSALFLEGQGWGFGGSVDVAPVDPWNVDGRYGWVGGTGTAAHVLPSTGLVTILLTQVELTGPTPPQVMRDVWTYAAGISTGTTAV